jgi:hypothetical protein
MAADSLFGAHKYAMDSYLLRSHILKVHECRAPPLKQGSGITVLDDHDGIEVRIGGHLVRGGMRAVAEEIAIRV